MTELMDENRYDRRYTDVSNTGEWHVQSWYLHEPYVRKLALNCIGSATISECSDYIGDLIATNLMIYWSTLEVAH